MTSTAIGATLDQEHERIIERRRLLDSAEHELTEGFTEEAVSDLIRVAKLLSDSEERVTRLFIECQAMLEQAGKILALDASLRPMIVHLDAPTPTEGTDK